MLHIQRIVNPGICIIEKRSHFQTFKIEYYEPSHMDTFTLVAVHASGPVISVCKALPHPFLIWVGTAIDTQYDVVSFSQTPPPPVDKAAISRECARWDIYHIGTIGSVLSF